MFTTSLLTANGRSNKLEESLTDDQEMMIAILAKFYLDHNGGSGDREAAVPFTEILKELKILHPVMYTVLSPPERRAHILSKPLKQFRYQNDKVCLELTEDNVLGAIDFTKIVEPFECEELPMHTDKEEAGHSGQPPKDQLREIINDLKTYNTTLQNDDEEIAYVLNTFGGSEKLGGGTDSNVENYFNRSVVPLKLTNVAPDHLGWRKAILKQLAIYYPLKVKVEFKQEKKSFVFINGKPIVFEGEDSLNEFHGVEYDSIGKYLRIVNISQFLSSPYVDETYNWLMEFHNLTENLGMLVKCNNGSLDLKKLDKYTFTSDVVAAAIHCALSICTRLPKVFTVKQGNITIDVDAYQKYLVNGVCDL